MGEPTREQIEHLIEKRDRAKGLYAVEIMVRVDALRALLDAYEERGREVERQEKLIDYLEQYGPKPLNERLERAEAETERLRAEVERLTAEAVSSAPPYYRRWQDSEARLAKVVRYVQDHDFKPARDWACAQCGDNPIVRPGFVCAWHEALAAVSPPRPSKGAFEALPGMILAAAQSEEKSR